MTKFYLIFLFPFTVLAQDNNPLEYMEQINKAYQPALTRQFDFARALAQGQPSDLVEKQRRVLLAEIESAREEIGNMPKFRGNDALRDSTVVFLDITYNLVNEDYAKIITLEPLAENGIEEMETFLNAQQEAYGRMSQVASGVKKAESDFARQFGVRLVDSDDKFARRLEDLNRIFEYYNDIYLTFFKAYQQEMNLFQAIEEQSLEAMRLEQRKLAAISEDGLARLNRIGSYKGDRNLRTAAIDNLEFYNNESEVVQNEVIMYYAALEKLSDLKRSLSDQQLSREAKSRITREYNEQVQLVNQSTPRLNEINASLNLKRAEYLNDWNRESEAFLQKFIN